MSGKTLAIGIVVLVLGVIGFSSIFVVHQAAQAIVLQLGKPERVITNAGLNFKIPFVQNVIFFDKRVLDFDASAAEVPTLDQKQLLVDAYARYRIVDPLRFFQAVNNETQAESQLNNIINNSLRTVFGEVPLAVLMTEKRSDLLIDITAGVSRAAARLGIEVVDVRIKRVDLPRENSEAIFRRMQTQREQEARKIRAEGEAGARRIRADADKLRRVIIAEARKTGEITRGLGDAEATRLYNEAYGKDREFFDFYRSLLAMSRGLSGSTTSYVGPPKGDFYRFFESSKGLAAPAQ